MKIEKNHFYVIENFSGTGTDDFGNKTHRENTSIIYWSGDTQDEIQKDLIIRDATLEEKEYFWDLIDESPNNDDYAAIDLGGYEQWKQNK